MPDGSRSAGQLCVGVARLGGLRRAWRWLTGGQPPVRQGASSARGGSRDSWAAMCGRGVGGMTACAGVKQEWGLTSTTMTSSLSAECSPSFQFPPFFGWTPFWSWGMLGGRAEALACYRSLRRMDGMRVAKGPSLPLVTIKLLADGGAATLGNDDMLQSLPWSSGVGRVKEVAPRWLG
ncbi:Os03g0674000 [Oryza sativa Japonica Group]|uniref:Os03g0674000 protein n=1 Tax=Oryza sativa subsp. japonica TaxID=39947 RepID=A0A0P0W1Z5_ORYSJ|nr:Os03g0674000 [Oryza sativa Japonica Group]